MFQIDIDLDEISDLMAEARGLGLSYGRTRTGIPRDGDASFGPHRIIPRTRQTERVRANIRADRDRTRRAREVRDIARIPIVAIPNIDQPSTSSGIDSISENSRSRSPNGNTRRRVRSGGPTAASSSTRSRAKKTRKTRKRRVTSRGGATMVREVRIVEVNNDGEEEEIVSYVNVAAPSSKRRKKKSRKVQSSSTLGHNNQAPFHYC